MTTIDLAFLNRVYEIVGYDLGPGLAGLRKLLDSERLSQGEINRVIWPYASQWKKPSKWLREDRPLDDDIDRQTLLGGWAADALIVYVSFVQRNPTPSDQERHHRLVSGSVRKPNHDCLDSALYSSYCRLKHI